MIWPYCPQHGYSETYTWLTRILAGGDGSEQRIAMRPVPRLTADATYRLTPAQQRYAEGILHAYSDTAWDLPWWSEAVVVGGSVSIGHTTIPVDTRYGSFVVGGTVVLWFGPAKHETAVVTAVADDQLTVSTGVSYAYGGRSHVAPCYHAYSLDPIQWSRRRASCNLAVRWSVTDNPRLAVDAAADTYDGYEICPFTARRSGPLDVSVASPLQAIDTDIGRLGAVASVNTYPIATQEHQVNLHGKSDAWSFKQWLFRTMGRQKTFLVPTYQRDFALSDAVSPTDTTIDVIAAGRATLYGANPLRMYIGFWTGSALTVRRITAIADLGATERITLDAAVGMTIAVDSSVKIGWVDRCRLASDAVELTWLNTRRADSNLQVTRVWDKAAAFGDGLFGMGVMAG